MTLLFSNKRSDILFNIKPGQEMNKAAAGQGWMKRREGMDLSRFAIHIIPVVVSEQLARTA
jgi:hypothetical protein